MPTAGYFDKNQDPFEIRKISMEDVNANNIEEMGLHLNLSDQSLYFDFKLNHLSHEMKAQLYKQIQALVYTYKELHKVLEDADRKAEQS
jgi:hypothetical protein